MNREGNKTTSSYISEDSVMEIYGDTITLCGGDKNRRVLECQLYVPSN